MQKKPPPASDETPALNSAACNCQALRQAARHISRIYDGHLATEGLKTMQYSILAKLNRLGPLSINELAKLMVMDRTTLGRAVRPLERDKLLTIGGDDDGRKRRLQITSIGETRLKTATARWREAQKEFETAFGPSNAANLRSVLQRVVAET